jgi:hypothetical protein
MSFRTGSSHVVVSRSKLHFPLSFVLIVGGVLSVSLVSAAVPPATTQVSKLCEVQAGGYGFDQYDSGQQPDQQAIACNLSVPDATSEGNASAGLGPGIPQVGIATTGAQITTYNGIAKANFSANVQYHFEIQLINVLPNPPPALLPVLFGARGDGYSRRVGYGLARSIGVVHLHGDPLDFDDARFEFEAYVVDETAYDPIDEEYQEGGFNETRSLDLFPSHTYSVVMSTACELWAGPVGQNADASAHCLAKVDPLIGFDQARFDAIMGANTFPLSQYYAFVFSENVPLPPPASAVLSVAKSGSGTGTVTSDPAGISCGLDCGETYDTGTVVSLTATPDADSTFTGWTGCDSVDVTDACTVAMTSDRGVTASFRASSTKQYRLKVAASSSKNGAGVIESDDGLISCGDGGACMYDYDEGTTVVLESIQNEGSALVKWTPTWLGCGTEPTCAVTISKNITVKAKFQGPNKLNVKVVSKKGASGTVTSSIPGLDGNPIDCPATICQNYYTLNDTVTLTATPLGISSFAGWKPSSLGCGTNVSCGVAMDRTRNVQAVFAP